MTLAVAEALNPNKPIEGSDDLGECGKTWFYGHFHQERVGGRIRHGQASGYLSRPGLCLRLSLR